jgi:hypothetical protein
MSYEKVSEYVEKKMEKGINSYADMLEEIDRDGYEIRNSAVYGKIIKTMRDVENEKLFFGKRKEV